MAKAKDKETPQSSTPTLGDVALKLLSVDSQIFSFYEHKFVAMKVKTLAQIIIDKAGELSLDVAGLLAPRIFQFATVDGSEEAFTKSVDNMLEVALIAHDFIEDKPVPAAPPEPPSPPPASGDAGQTTGQSTGQTASPQA